MRNPSAIQVIDVGLLAGIIIIFAIAGCSDMQDNAAVPTLMSLSPNAPDLDAAEESASEPLEIETPQIPTETPAIIQPGADLIPSERSDSTDSFSETTTILQSTAPSVYDEVPMETNAGSGPPVIVTQPSDQVVFSGETATLTVEVDGTEPVAYQWYEGISGDTSTPVGTDSPSYTTPALTTTTQYWVHISNGLGSADSTTATISISDVSIIQITDTSAASSEWVDTGVLSGDGSRMAFSAKADLTGENADGNLEVFLWDQFADDFRQLSNTDNGFSSSAPFTSNSGGAVVFHSNGQMSYNPEGVDQIFKWDQSDPYYAYSPQEIYLSQSHDSMSPFVSEDGKKVIFKSTFDYTGSNPDGNFEIFLVNLDPYSVTQITNTSVTNVNSPTDITPDGTRIVFVSNVDLTSGNSDGSIEVFLWDETDDFTQITDTENIFEEVGPLPSLDNSGTRITFYSTQNLTGGNLDGNREVFLWQEGVGLTQITNTTVGSCFGPLGPVISGDGSRIAFASTSDLTGENSDGSQEVFLWDEATGFHQLTSSTVAMSNVVTSINYDGTRIAFSSDGDLTGNNSDCNREMFLATVLTAPTIIEQPYEQIIGSGGTAVLQVKAVGNLPLHFQWYQGISGDTSIPVGTDNQFLTIAGLTATTQYWVRITNDVGVTDSAAAPVTVYTGSSTCSTQQLTDLEAGITLQYPSISDDGTRIAFKSTGDLTGENTDYSEELFLWDQVEGFTQITYDQTVNGVKISGNGSRIVVNTAADLTGGNSDGNIEVFLWAEGDGFTQITDTLASAYESNQSISINDDGTRIAFSSTADLTSSGSTSEQTYLWEEGVGFTQTTNQLTGSGKNIQTRISGAGSRILLFTQADLLGSNPEGNQEFYLWDETSGLSQLTNFTTNWVTTGSIDDTGNCASLFSYWGGFEVTKPSEYPELTLWEDGVGFTRITSSTLYGVFGGVISGDGQHMAFLSNADLTGENPDNYQQIFLWEQGSGFTQITQASYHLYFDAYPDGDGSRLVMAGPDDLTGGNPDGSDELFLVICDEAPEIVTQPVNQTILSGETATLTVEATGTGSLTYQWYEGAVGDTSTPVGTGSPNYTTPALTATTSYWVRITSALGSVDSTTATVTVTSAFCATVSEIPNSECMALEALYTSTTGVSWTNHTDWMDTNTPCSWHGVECITGRVTALRLEGNQLSGTIPSSLSNLTNLTALELDSNQLTGTIPPELGSLTNLGLLDLKDNQLTGTIPPELGNLANLIFLSLDINQLSGEIPSELGNLTNLEGLFLSMNQLTGSIPPELGDLPQLWQLFLFDNQLSGEIPPELGNLDDLFFLLLDHNQLSGTIPVELSNPSQLNYLGLGDNNLTGTIPPELGNLTNLGLLMLNGNQLTGTIPPELGNLTNLGLLMLSDNQLTGAIPSELGNITGLETLLLQNNALEGEIPASLTDLVNLDTVDNLPFYPWSGDDEVGFGYNKLVSTNQDVIDFLDVKDPDWADTQTIPPTNVHVGAVTMDSVTLSWNPIPYTGDGGYYQIYYAQNIAGPYVLHGSTSDKSASGYEAESLLLGMTYYFKIRTYTPMHGDQQNNLYSDFSPAIEATTLTLGTFCEGVNEEHIPQAECEALVSLYTETDGAGWTDTTNWLDTFTPCDWYGVTCSGGHVTIINLEKNNLIGLIPTELQNLPNLVQLRLTSNQLSGTIPTQLSSLTNLVWLTLSNNQLEGSIPIELSNLANLQFLYLSHNQLTGSIPSQLGLISSLRALHLDENQLTGSIPSEIGDLSNLQMLYLYSNQLVGSIPPELGQLSNLDTLALANNQLTGSIPPELGNLAKLWDLWLANNQLTGSIPAELGNLTNIRYFFDLSNNALSGEIPASITNLVNMDAESTDFGYNKLYSTNQDVVDFLDIKDPDWAQTQTILPDNIQVDTVTVDSVTLIWDPISYTSDGGFYEVHYATTPGGPYTLHGQTPGKSATGYTAGSLLPSTTYYFVVRTYTPAHGDQQNALTTDFSTEVNGTTEFMGLNAPTSLEAVAVSQTQIDLSWVDNSSDETAFLLQRSLTGVSGWEDIPALGADTTTYSDSGLSCHTRYYYRVSAYRDGDGQTSAFSNIASAVTNLCPAPDAPTNLTATPASLTEISLSWVDNSDETAFHIERSLYGVNWTEIATVSAEQTTYTNGGLACSATFRYRVRAYRAGDGQYSEYSNVVVGSTQVCLPPNQPGLYSVIGTGIDRIHIVWADNSIDETAFMVEHSPDGSSNWEQIAMLPANQNTYTHIGLPCHTTHYYRVRAYRNRDNQYSIYSVVMGTSTQACPPATTATVGLYQNGFWQFRDSNSTGPADLHFAFGLAQPNWTPVVGDWDGDGVDGIGVYKDGMWMLRNSATSGQPDLTFIFNPLGVGAIPVVGDWNRDGIDTIGVYKDGMWALRDSNSGGNYDYAFIFNPAGTGAVPITGDWDGDGIDTAGIYKNSVWYLNNSHASVDRAGGFIYGPAQSSNWLPVIGDWNHDGIDGVGLYRDGIWRLRNSNSAGAPDIGFVFGDGFTGWKPVAGYRGGLSGLMALGLSETWLPAEPTIVPSATPGDAVIPVSPTSTPLPTVIPELTETVEPTEVVIPTATAIPPTNTPEPTATAIPPTNTPEPTDTPISEVTSEPGGN